MRVLLTGVTGFIGRRLAQRLAGRDHEVHGIARYVSDRELRPSDVTIHHADLLDPLKIGEVLERVSPDVVVHLATQSSVEYSFNHPYESYRVGFMGTVNVAQQCLDRLPELQRFVFSSSVEVYGNRSEPVLDESLPPEPASPYGVTKAAAETMLLYLHRAHDFPAVVFRNTNTYGRRHNHRFVVEKAIYEMLNGAETVRMGDPEPVRDFLYIADEIDAYVDVIEAETAAMHGEIYNTGTERPTKIRDLVELIRDRTGFEHTIEWHTASYRPLEIDRLVLDNSKLDAAIGWQPNHTLEEGLDKTIESWEGRLR